MKPSLHLYIEKLSKIEYSINPKNRDHFIYFDKIDSRQIYLSPIAYKIRKHFCLSINNDYLMLNGYRICDLITFPKNKVFFSLNDVYVFVNRKWILFANTTQSWLFI